MQKESSRLSILLRSSFVLKEGNYTINTYKISVTYASNFTQFPLHHIADAPRSSKNITARILNEGWQVCHHWLSYKPRSNFSSLV